MDVISTDVVIIGAGGAGLRAAIAVAETDPSLSLCLLSKVYPMRSHTVAAEGGAAGVIKDNDSLDYHFHDTVSGGDWLCDQDAVELFVNAAPLELLQMEHWGCPWSREPSGKVAVRPFGGMKIERTWYAADKTGFHMLHTLFQTSLKYPSIKRFDEYYSTDLLGRGRALHRRRSRSRCGRAAWWRFTPKRSIIATGGAGRIFPFTTNGAIKTGDGMAMAYRAGVPLKDMEFVQYHPTGLPGTGILITEGSRGEGGILINKDGYRYLQDYNLGPPDPWPRKKAMELGPRDRLSQAFWHEQQKGPHHQDALWRCGASWTFVTSARRRSTSACPWCANWRRAMSASTRCMSRSRCGRWCITRWAASTPTSMPQRPCPACSPPANAPAYRSTAPIASAPIR